MAKPTELLKGLVEIYSPSQQERAAVEYLVAQMSALGFRAFIDDAGNAVGILGNGPREVVLLGHIDTFHGFIDVRQEDGKLYGRGSVDAKGCLATFVSACTRVGARDGVRFVVIGAVEEECATSRGARFAVTQYRPDFCIVGEPSGWDRITLGYKGRVNVDYDFSQGMTHGASSTRPATENAVAFWARVAEYAAGYNVGKPRIVDQLDPSLRSINSSDDGFTDRVTMRVNVRVPLGLTIEAVEQQIAQFADGAQLEFSSEEPPFRADKNNALVRAFLGAIRDQGGKPAFTLKTGTADMNIAGPAWQCPIVAYGPGDSTLDHTPNEHLDLAEYARAIDVLARVLTTL
ncbi:MAG: [LysW]-lysine hydrolase [Chloroflexi bacterium]|nr:[LysW]-lysine hydrolase [Chloroflexota bacterium]